MSRRLPSREALSIVERGWRGARECSLALGSVDIAVRHLIKGRLSRDVRSLIRPYPHIRLASVPRRVFRVWLWATLLARTLTGRLRWVLVDQPRTLRQIGWWCRAFGVTAVLIEETDDGCTLFVEQQPRPAAAIFAL